MSAYTATILHIKTRGFHGQHSLERCAKTPAATCTRTVMRTAGASPARPAGWVGRICRRRTRSKGWSVASAAGLRSLRDTTSKSLPAASEARMP